jgi:hypothetical protein
MEGGGMRRGGFLLCLLALVLVPSCLTGCASKKLGPAGLLGYWRGPDSFGNDPFSPHLILIRRVEGRYLLRAPVIGWDVPLAVLGNRLVRRHPGSREYELFSQRPGQKLALADYYRGAGTQPITVILTPARGSTADLAAELHGWCANSTISLQTDTLQKALGTWRKIHGHYPARSALLPGGAFWRWSVAPQLTNAVTGGPMRLGPDPGNFDYSSGTYSVGSEYWLTVHFYGGLNSTYGGS